MNPCVVILSRPFSVGIPERWASADFNAPDEATCFEMLDRAVLKSGVNLIDTAEQYPIPSGYTSDGAVFVACLPSGRRHVYL